MLPYLQPHLTIGEIGGFLSRITVSWGVSALYWSLGVTHATAPSSAQPRSDFWAGRQWRK
jgi:hypothetical protein